MNNKHDDADKDNDVKKVNDAIAFKKSQAKTHRWGEFHKISFLAFCVPWLSVN